MAQIKIIERSQRQSGNLNAHQVLVIKCISEGLTVAQTANKLRITFKSVATTLELIRGILDVKNSPHMVAVAIREGIIC